MKSPDKRCNQVLHIKQEDVAMLLGDDRIKSKEKKKQFSLVLSVRPFLHVGGGECVCLHGNQTRSTHHFAAFILVF